MSENWINKFYVGDAYKILAKIPDNTADMLVTSPPYWGGIRDYKVDGQLGHEETAEEYVTNLVTVFREASRVLKPIGSIYVVIGDMYNNKGLMKDRSKKCLCQIPELFDLNMVANGFVKRNTIIYHKINSRPSSTKIAFTSDFEYMYFYVMQDNYYFEQQLDPYTKPLDRWGGDDLTDNGYSKWDEVTGQKLYRKRSLRPNPEGRNKRCVWSLNCNNEYLRGTKHSHPATFPRSLIETPIRASCPVDGVVIDVFSGIGTTALTALELGRNFIGIELNPNYVETASQLVRGEFRLPIEIIN